MDENYFFSAFEDVPKVNLYSARDVDDTMGKIKEVVSNASSDWDKRVEMVSVCKAMAN